MSQVGLAPETETDEAICLNYLFDSLQLCTTATLFFSLLYSQFPC